ncbi:hypothetical protein, partial [Leptospira kanakyensis]
TSSLCEKTQNKLKRKKMEKFDAFLNNKMISVVTIVISAYISISAIAEVISRQDMLSVMESKIVELTKEGLEINQNILTELSQNKSDSKFSIEERYKKNDELFSVISEIKKISSRLKTLILSGSMSKSESLHNMSIQYTEQLKAVIEKDQESYFPYIHFSNYDPVSVKTRSSTYLVALAALLSGIIGSLITSFRFTKYSIDYLKRLVLGLATGYISFLLIRGGKSAFLLEGSESLPLMNPSSTALFSLIGGMFTEKLFNLLGKLFDNFVKKIVNEDTNTDTEEPQNN